MGKLVDTLHDEIDAQEDLREMARDLVDRVKADTISMAHGQPNFQSLTEDLALAIADELSELTTLAAKTGLNFGRKRAMVQRAGNN